MKRFLVLATTLAMSMAAGEELPPSCDRPIYCESKLLHHAQMNRLYPDSKTFVDLQMKNDSQTILTAFDELLNDTNNNPTKEQLQEFVFQYFNNGSELESWSPPDYNANPSFLTTIRDKNLRQFAKNVNDIWPSLGRKVKTEVLENPSYYSLIPVDNGFIIPGGRFTELYYWDTYWIIEGLLVSEMKNTAKGVISNLIQLLKKIGHIPNGSRWYYQQRSQPPLLSAMMAIYIEETGDIKFLKENIDSLEKELQYWLDTQRVTFSMDDQNRAYTLLRYYVPSRGPRPESYYEDYKNAQAFETESRQQEFYNDVKSAAESGWDFSSRWFIDKQGDNDGNLTNIHTEYIIPVDLNSIFANALFNMGYFYTLLQERQKAVTWWTLANQWRNDIEGVLWNEEDGIWYDYDTREKIHRKYFYPSNLSPLWMRAIDKENVQKHAKKVINYLKTSEALDFPGGIPTSLKHTGEQWDFPNAWPPLVSIIVNALEALQEKEAYEMAFDVAQTWVRACYKGYKETHHMYEKYNAEVPGGYGEGGEYTVQSGFGWSNGVVLEFLAKYGRKMTAYENDTAGNTSSTSPPQVLTNNKVVHPNQPSVGS